MSTFANAARLRLASSAPMLAALLMAASAPTAQETRAPMDSHCAAMDVVVTTRIEEAGERGHVAGDMLMRAVMLQSEARLMCRQGATGAAARLFEASVRVLSAAP